MQIGQIVYRLQDYHNKDSEVSTNKKGIVVAGMGDLDMTSNLFGQFAEGVSYRNAKITKLGVQAPPHTKMIIDGRDIQVGNTGIYELDDDIIIEKIKFKTGQKLQNVIIDFIYNQ